MVRGCAMVAEPDASKKKNRRRQTSGRLCLIAGKARQATGGQATEHRAFRQKYHLMILI